MKAQVVGIQRRQVTNDQTGQVTIWSNIQCIIPYSDYDLQHGAEGFKTQVVNTRLNTSKINIQDNIDIQYEPTGFTNKDGSQQFAVARIDVIK